MAWWTASILTAASVHLAETTYTAAPLLSRWKSCFASSHRPAPRRSMNVCAFWLKMTAYRATPQWAPSIKGSVY